MPYVKWLEGQSDIFPLLCDLLPEGTGFVVMLKVYLDRGAKKDMTDGVMCMSSVIFKPTPYKQFFRPWNRMLKAWDAFAFHATDFYNGAEEFKRDTPYRKRLFEEDCKRIPKMIGHHVERISLISFRPDEFDRVVPPEWKEKFGASVHSHAVQLSLIANGWWRQDKCPSESFAYFMETGDTDEGMVLQHVEAMRSDIKSGTSAVIGVKSFTSADKGTARGLEAADFAAWHWNKYYMDKIRAGVKDKPRKDFEAFVNAAEGKIEYMFLTEADLKYFFSLASPKAENVAIRGASYG